MQATTRENERMRKILDSVQDQIQTVWDKGHRVKITIEAIERRKRVEDGDDPVPVDGLDDDADKPVANGDGMDGDGDWVRIRNGIGMDTCCAANVMPYSWLPQLVTEPGKSRQRYIGATGKIVQNKGQKTIQWMTNEGQGRSVVFQMTDVSKILACVAQVCDGENDVLFRKNGGMIIPIGDAKIEIKPNSNVTHFGRKGNMYSMDAWIKKDKVKTQKKVAMEVDAVSGFIRQGVRT